MPRLPQKSSKRFAWPQQHFWVNRGATCRAIFVDAERNEARSLIPGDSSDVWTAVQKEVEQFAHVCSYDRLGLGRSDKLSAPHTADEIVDDLHQLLKAARLLPPYVMVGHSIGGIYVRKYAALYPAEVLDWYW